MLLAANSPDHRDTNRGNRNTGTIATDNRFGETYVWQSQAFELWEICQWTKSLSGSGHQVTARFKMSIVSEAFVGDKFIFVLQGSTQNPETPSPFSIVYAGIIYNNTTGKIYVGMRDVNLNVTASSDGATTISAGSNYDVEFRMEWTSSTSLTLTVRLDGTTEITHTHTAGGGVGTNTYTRMCMGVASTPGKGETWDVRYGGIATVSDESTTGQGFTGWPRTDHPNLAKTFILPTADGSVVAWTNSIAGADAAGEDVTCVDDILGSLSTAENVASGTTAADQNEYMATWTNSITSTDTIYGIMLGAYGNSPIPQTNIRIGLYDGAEDTRTPVTIAVSGVEIIPFITDSGGNDWAQSDISGLEGRWRRVAAGTENWIIYGVWMLVIHEAVAAAAAQNTQAPTFFAAGGVGVV